jgi:hypothetical protein
MGSKRQIFVAHLQVSGRHFVPIVHYSLPPHLHVHRVGVQPQNPDQSVLADGFTRYRFQYYIGLCLFETVRRTDAEVAYQTIFEIE